jgi:hypothetical protein
MRSRHTKKHTVKDDTSLTKTRLSIVNLLVRTFPGRLYFYQKHMHCTSGMSSLKNIIVLALELILFSNHMVFTRSLYDHHGHKRPNIIHLFELLRVSYNPVRLFPR